MKTTTLAPPTGSLAGTIEIPGDKSISHRAAIFGAMAKGETIIEGFLSSEDCLRTLESLSMLGVRINKENDVVTIKSDGYDAFTEPERVLDMGNSGTTIRLLLGVLAARPFYSVLAGDESLHKRPMGRVIRPLSQMGASFLGRDRGNLAPLTVNGGSLQAMAYESQMASGQVKSAILLAGIQTNGGTSVTEPAQSRDHTERMIPAFGGNLEQYELTSTVKGPQMLHGAHVKVPGDISSAAFFIAAALITPGSDVMLRNVGMNPTRTGILNVLDAMGADYQVVNETHFNQEPVADLRIRYSELQSTVIEGDLIPRLIDEIPVIALMATQAQGTTTIRDAEELRVKETNRIDATVTELSKLGVEIEETRDGMIIHGHPGQAFTGAKTTSYGDHRIGMTLAVASCNADTPVTIDDIEAIDVSFPGFLSILNSIK
ncbi:3-phosphoshikimate 1-carboxyvinyltransferase [Tuberibacillus sp. Marseille-P3662]|uniref:3-phosphoshikimate 1-carboxyvinyltransferase n=1 Tax=Tuberibacillus sp. Marseille-P3662 TaxID=1965358 RepID=UPI000A1CC1B3|nr:3-phosphoshikimate 1-carboxyvinyltransferase [Tuberibacillus sp. Marseille-P3662]